MRVEGQKEDQRAVFLLSFSSESDYRFFTLTEIVVRIAMSWLHSSINGASSGAATNPASTKSSNQ